MSVDEYWANHGKAFDPNLSEQEMEELLNWWLLCKSKQSSNNSGRIPSFTNEAISHLQEKLQKIRSNRQASAQHTTNLITNTINVSGPFSGILQAGQENKAISNEVSSEQGSAVKELGKEIPWWKSFDRRIAIIGLIVAVIGLWYQLKNQ